MAILRTNGFVQLRRGLIEHVMNQQMTLTEFTVYTLLIIHADPSTGVWRGCSETIAQTYGLPPRTCRDIFQRLENNGYLKRFFIKGKKGIYPVLINRFECTDGAMKGKRLNTCKSTSLTNLIYEECRDDAVTVPGQCRDGATTVPLYREEENKRIDTLSPSFALTPPQSTNGNGHSPRFTPGEIESIYQQYPRKIGKQPALKAIKKALENLDDENPVAALRARVIEFANSPAGQKGEFVPYPEKWFNKKRYLDDPKEWEK
jgi:hypothetical protein